MVGVAILKDFESGSFERIRLTFYEGKTFEDLERGGDFLSCTVNLEKRSIDYDLSGSGNMAPPRMKLIFDICRRVRELWMSNSYASIVRFLANHGDITLQLASEKTGLYEPPDIYALFDKDNRDVYKLISVIRDKDYLFASSLCDALNFGICAVYGIEEPLYFYASCGIYINIPLARALSGRRLALPKALSRYARGRTGCHAALRSSPQLSLEREAEDKACYGALADMICSYRVYKCRAAKHIKKLASSAKIKELIFSLPDDPEIRSLTEKFCFGLEGFTEITENRFYAKSHIRYITVKDMLTFACNPRSVKAIIGKGRAASINYKLHSALPCPQYYDSRGRAYRQKG